MTEDLSGIGFNLQKNGTDDASSICFFLGDCWPKENDRPLAQNGVNAAAAASDSAPEKTVVALSV